MMTIDPTWSDTMEVEPGLHRIIHRPIIEIVDGWALINLPARDRPKSWTFIPAFPEPEVTMGGDLGWFCPLYTVQPVKMAGREHHLRRRHYPSLEGEPETYWDCEVCLTTWPCESNGRILA
jgi:hypothetical protein